MNFQQAAAEYLPQIKAEMKRIMAGDAADPFWGMMHYHLGWLDETFRPADASTGKQLRPLFTMLTCYAAGGDPTRALPAAAAIELTHNFTLIHDDIQDGSNTRRGRKTVWRLWGMPQAINIGDAMFTLARGALLQLRRHNVSPETILNATEKYDETMLALCRGQYLDMKFEETPDVSLKAYLEMIAGKTAALLACAGYFGALVATENPTTARRYWDFGHTMGIAFQMQDDLLGIWGDAGVVGKPSGDDLRRRKKTLPVIFALNCDPSADVTRFRDIYAQPISDTTEADIAEAMGILESLGAREYTALRAELWLENAAAALAMIDMPREAKRTLQEFSDLMIQRVK